MHLLRICGLGAGGAERNVVFGDKFYIISPTKIRCVLNFLNLKA
jgi:hypothetical protein